MQGGVNHQDAARLKSQDSAGPCRVGTGRREAPDAWRGGAGESACRRDSVPRSLAGVRFGDHPSVRPTWGVAPDGDGRAVRPRSALLRVGVAEPPGSPPTLVRSYRTVSPLPVRRPGATRPSAVCSLLPFPSGRPDLALASTLPCGVPTFLDAATAPDGPRSRGHPADSPAPPVSHSRSGCGSSGPPGPAPAARTRRSGRRGRPDHHMDAAPVGSGLVGWGGDPGWEQFPRDGAGGEAPSRGKNRSATGGRAPPVADQSCQSIASR